MYYGHFGLIRPPFKITPDTSFFYSGGERGSVLDALSYVVLSGEGITKVIGEVGSGKTMLCRMLEERLPEHVETVYIANPSISPENILNVIAFEAGLIDKPGSKLEVMQRLQEWLLQKFGQNRRVVVLIEEAQGMPLETLEELRLLSNLETAQDKLLQLVLFGQPELDENLAQPSIRQLRERITHNFYLNPFARNQAQDYLNFRIRNAGYRGPDLFDAKVSRLIGFYSRGLVRRINILADKVLLAAYADNTTRLREAHVRKAAVDSRFPGAAASRWRLWGVALASLLAGLCLASLIWWWQQREPLAARAGLSPSATAEKPFFRHDG
ncbi:MAG TPA: AAA family ATPase [Gammaproteobacteria bacterium]|nr:AAA family ATPase [Gammaproteobacteria bacterium]